MMAAAIMATVLVVDDSATARIVCRTALSKNGYTVLEAQDGREALTLFRDRKPDLVLMDIEMPGMNGLAALELMRRLDPAARVVMLTSMAQRVVMAEASRAGACDFLVKPIQPEPLVQLVNKVLGQP